MTSPSRAIALITLVSLTLVVAWAGRAAEGRRALGDAEAALERGDATDAVLAFRIAAEARCPGCTAPSVGFVKLEKIARDAEARGDDTTAFAAWRATRAAWRGTTFNGAATVRRDQADREIARFGQRIDAAAVAGGATPTQAASEDRLRRTLAESDIPNGTTFALVALGGIVFLGSALRFARSTTAPSRKQSALAVIGAAATGAALAAAGVLLF